MHPGFKIFLRVLFVIFLVIGIYLTTIIGIGITTDYQPESITELKLTDSVPNTISDSIFTFLSWNIGYCGLGKEVDFFYDGGKMVHPSKDLVKKYTSGILDFLLSVDTIDFILLQEVDKKSNRTSKQDEVEIIKNNLSNHSTSFGYNYKVRFVPIPFLNPLGRVEMGQMNLSSFNPVQSKRYSFFSAYSWPMRLFMLDRCFIVSRFNLKNSKQLIVINTHNSAYDSGGKLREQEMLVIRDLMVKEYNKGNYVVAGGDWNQNPPGYDPDEMKKDFEPAFVEKLKSEIFPDGWNIIYDSEYPTNRSLDYPLIKGKTKVTIIDYFIVSPNVHVKNIETLSQSFEFSDHEPVFLKVELN